jgi:LacI family transcriptional regulator
LKERGIHVPEDVGLVGFSDLKFMDILEVPLTTVRENIAQIGRKAIEILLYQIVHPEDSSRKVLVEPELIIRQSA